VLNTEKIIVIKVKKNLVVLPVSRCKHRITLIAKVHAIQFAHCKPCLCKISNFWRPSFKKMCEPITHSHHVQLLVLYLHSLYLFGAELRHPIHHGLHCFLTILYRHELRLYSTL